MEKHMATASNRLKKKAKNVAEDIQEMNGAAKDVAQEKIGQLQATVSGYYEQGRDKVLDAKRSVGQFIYELPIKSILIALGAGILLGTFWTIRRR
jgi:ElaB/YqjD/DUF883 family membrane-anchored ribosome-binding protein